MPALDVKLRIVPPCVVMAALGVVDVRFWIGTNYAIVIANTISFHARCWNNNKGIVTIGHCEPIVAAFLRKKRMGLASFNVC